MSQVKLWSPGNHWGVVAETAQFRAGWLHSAARKLRQQTGVGGDQPVEIVVGVIPFLVRAIRPRGDDLAARVAGVGLGVDRDQQRVPVVDRGDPAVDDGALEPDPVENIWQFMRDNWLSNQIFQSYWIDSDIPIPKCRATPLGYLLDMV